MSGILIVEDERLVARDIEESLRGLGYPIAGSVASADDALRQALSNPPDLVLMDVHIHGEVDGVEVARALRRQLGTPVVYITAYTDRDTLARARETGAYGYIVKPFDTSELHCAIEIALFKHKMEQRLREREHWFSTTLRSIADAVVAVDPAGSVTYMNLAAEGLLGSDFVEKPFTDVVQLVDESTRRRVDNPLQRALTERVATSVPHGTALVAPKGDIPIEDSAAPIIDDEGNLLGAVLVFRDVGQKRRLEQSVAIAQRMTSLGTLSAGVAHEINNPLAYVLANAEFADQELTALRNDLAPDPSLPPDVRERIVERVDDVLGAVHELGQGADRIAKIVRDLRVFSRPSNKETTTMSVINAVEWAIRVTRTELRHRASLVKDLGPVPNVLGDEGRLGQVFVNLLTNAIHAMPEATVSDNLVEVSTSTDADGYAVIQIRDNGSGIEARLLERIFDPFFTTKPTSTSSGLGLSICHSIVTAMSGEIRVESQPGVGTTVSVRLPPALAAPAQPAKSPDAPAVLRGRILIVDDEPMIVDALRRILQDKHEVRGTTHAKEALEILQSESNIDLVLCDLMMPEMSGMDLYRRLRERAPAVAARMVFITGGVFAPRAAEFLRSVDNPCLEKPIRASELEALIQNLLAKHSQPSA